MNQPLILDPLNIRLSGRHVIEASAGTGKTWTLAALYVRLVLGHERDAPLLPPQILVMTFTEAATAELRERIRERLRDAARWFDHRASGVRLPADFQADPFLEQLLQTYDDAHWPQCSLRLNMAADWMDEAAIYTIHGWSRRMLSQYALNSQMLFEQNHLEDAPTLLLELMQDYWRTWIYPLEPQAVDVVLAWLGHSPENALDLVLHQWREDEKQPLESTPTVPPPQALIEAYQQWQQQGQDLCASVRALWTAELTHDLLTLKLAGTSEKNKAGWINALQAWLHEDQDPDIKKIGRLGWKALQEKKWSALEKWTTELQTLDTFIEHYTNPPDVQASMVQHVSQTLKQAYHDAKLQRAAFDFSDLLQQLFHALHRDEGALAQAIRTQYPVALVDEFQDTDPWQYGSLDQIYAPAQCTAQHAFIMIGDPKQAIYSFRGADLATYLKAREQALALNPQSVHTLTGNFRSCAPLVQAINHLFTHDGNPFESRQAVQINYVTVTPESSAQPLMHEHQALAALTFCQLYNGPETIKSGPHLDYFAHYFSNLMASLLQQQIASPGDMAVLVRGQKHALQMQIALRARGIPSVYLSDRSSVYSSQEATSLWRFLRACATPNRLNHVRAAIASASWCLERSELEQLMADESAWQSLIDQFHQWHALWLSDGILPLLQHWLHTPFLGATLAQRLRQTPEGERSLSNLLHLGELLAHASQQLQGVHALLRHLEQSIAHPPQDNDSQKSRLETDAQCVQIITYHKSKGLQYPLVFIPYAGSFSYERTHDEDDQDAPSSTEEDMRLLYVALTRAQRALWVGVAETHYDISKGDLKKPLKRSALSQLLGRQERGDLRERLETLCKQCEAIHYQCIDFNARPQMIRYEPPNQTPLTRRALINQRTHFEPWWTASFSAITRGLLSYSETEDKIDDATTDASLVTTLTPSSEIEATLIPLSDVASPWQSFPAGARYGTLLHDLLEWQAKQDWPLAATAQVVPSLQQEWLQLVTRKTQWLELPDEQIVQLHAWMRQIISTPLPLQPYANNLALHQLHPPHLWAEMSFHLETHHVATHTLDDLIRTHLWPSKARPVLQDRALHGMLTGFMDLVFEHEGRYWVLDYKSNRLEDYGDDALTHAVLDKRYDVQYVLYTLALHRLLQSRMVDYDYDVHMGGAVYLFLRGIDQPHAGVHLMRPPRELIDALDRLFQGVLV